MIKYSYLLSGTGAGGHAWSTKGTVEAKSFPDCLDEAMRETFYALTQGKAVYGVPGVACRGPYKIRKFEMEEVVQ